MSHIHPQMTRMRNSACIAMLPIAWMMSTTATALDQGSLDFEQRINGKAVLHIIDPICERLQDLSAVFFSEQDVVIYGIVLTQDGYIATKASELHAYRDLIIRIGSVKYDRFTEIGMDPATDVAVIKVNAQGLPVSVSTNQDVSIGTLVVSNGSTTRTSRRPQLGVISTMPHPVPKKDSAYLGIAFGSPCYIQEINPDGPAAQAGAREGDKILSIDNIPVANLDAIAPILGTKKIGDSIVLNVKRQEQQISYTIIMGSRRQITGKATEDANDHISGGYSQRRDDFPMVLQHDTPSRNNLMGGPLLNLKGELIGMNIARVNRAENYALPIYLVLESVQNILKNNIPNK